MAADKTTNRYEDLLKSAHKGIDLDQPVHKTGQEEKVAEPVDTIPVDVVADGSDPAKMEPDNPPASTTSISTELPSSKTLGKKKRKTQGDYQDMFFVRVDFTHRNPSQADAYRSPDGRIQSHDQQLCGKYHPEPPGNLQRRYRYYLPYK